MADARKIAGGAAAGLLAAGAAAAGYYFYASKDAKRNRRIAAKWANDMKRDVVRTVSKMPSIDRKGVLAAVDSAVAAYESARGVSAEELTRAAQELRKNWGALASEVRRTTTAARAGVRAAKRSARATAPKKKRSRG